MLGFFCHVSYFDEVALGGSHSLVTLHSIYYLTKPNSTTVHLRLAFAAALPVVRASVGFEIAR